MKGESIPKRKEKKQGWKTREPSDKKKKCQCVWKYILINRVQYIVDTKQNRDLEETAAQHMRRREAAVGAALKTSGSNSGCWGRGVGVGRAGSLESSKERASFGPVALPALSHSTFVLGI